MESHDSELHRSDLLSHSTYGLFHLLSKLPKWHLRINSTTVRVLKLYVHTLNSESAT